MRTVRVARDGEGPTLQAALQLAGLAQTGGQAKQLIQAGAVTVNGQVEQRRSHRLQAGDVVACQGDEVELAADDR